MVLSDVEALRLLQNPRNRPAINEALRYQNRVRFHGLTTREKNASAHWPTFKKWVHGFLLVDDKQDLFENIYPFPTPSTRLLAEVQDYWLKLFDSVNPSLIIDAADGINTDFLSYLDSIGEPDFWPDEFISALLESNNDLLLIDLKPGVTGKPEPYLQRLALDSVISLVLNDDATAQHVAYRAVDGTVVLVDSMSYRVYEVKDADYSQVGIYPHLLGRCPARLLWDERIPNHAIASSSPVDEVLSELDQYAFWYVAYDMFKLYGAFPIYYGAEERPQDAAPALLLPLNTDGSVDAGYENSCYPKRPGAKSFIGAGEYWEMPFGSDLSIPPVGIVEPSTPSLQFQSEDRERLYNKLVSYLVGNGGESSSISNEAMNEKQIAGNFSSQENALRYLSRHASAAREWVLQLFGELRYGAAFKAVNFSFGTEWYLQTEADLWDGLSKARLAGSPQAILAEKIRGIQSFRLRSGGNPTRSQLLLDLEPLAEQSLPAVQALALTGVVTTEKLAVKANFTDLIAQYERELGADIVVIGAGLPYVERINRIQQYLYNNVTAETTNVQSIRDQQRASTNRNAGPNK